MRKVATKEDAERLELLNDKWTTLVQNFKATTLEATASVDSFLQKSFKGWQQIFAITAAGIQDIKAGGGNENVKRTLKMLVEEQANVGSGKVRANPIIGETAEARYNQREIERKMQEGAVKRRAEEEYRTVFGGKTPEELKKLDEIAAETRRTGDDIRTALTIRQVR